MRCFGGAQEAVGQDACRATPQLKEKILKLKPKDYGGEDSFRVMAFVLEQPIVIITQETMESNGGSGKKGGGQLFSGTQRLGDTSISAKELVKKLKSDDPPIVVKYNGVNHYTYMHSGVSFQPAPWLKKAADMK